MMHQGHMGCFVTELSLNPRPSSDAQVPALLRTTNIWVCPRMRRFPGPGLDSVIWGQIWANQDEMVTWHSLSRQGTPGDQGSRTLFDHSAFLTPASPSGHGVSALQGLPSPRQPLFSLFPGWGFSQRGPCDRRKSNELQIRRAEQLHIFLSVEPWQVIY